MCEPLQARILKRTRSRRKFLKLAAGAGLGALAASVGCGPKDQPPVKALPAAQVLGPVGAQPAAAANDLTPIEVLERLRQGNQRFMTGNVTADHRDMARLREVAAAPCRRLPRLRGFPRAH